ncbi:hypothetical protein FH972_026438 [Carpinus fangiana]|uniref:Uncharacterized protein n=1 Tax=Carpinus fangiana TaxID=176857 RepID=A0A5N6L3Z4_9ROSI|nr:hypothetical protein FH972_026438 [Carpinus fangiana]
MAQIVFVVQINLRVYIRALKDFHELKRKIVGLYYLLKQVDYFKEENPRNDEEVLERSSPS